MADKAIIYTRFSPKPDAKECDSCKKQLGRCQTYCRKQRDAGNGEYEVVGVFSDEGQSGGILNRPGLRRALDCMRSLMPIKGDVILLVDSVSRLARDMLVTLTIRHEVSQAGGWIEYADGSPTDVTPEGELFSNILAAFASYERSRIRYATSRGMKLRQENGEFFGKPPVGFMRDPECSTRLIECEEEQEAMRIAKRLSKARWNSAAIAKTLTDDWCLFRGKPWSARTIRKILAGEE